MKARMLKVIFFHLLAICLFYHGCVSPQKKERDYITIGNDYAQDGLLREAINSYRKALAKEPQNSLGHRNLGIAYVRTGEYRAAIRHLERSIGDFNNNFEANFYLAESYRAIEKFAEAIYRYQRALKIRANDPRTLKALAWSFFKIRYYSEALDTAKNLVSIAPDDGQAAIILARTYLKLRQHKKALSTLLKAKANAEPNNIPYFQSVEGDILFAMSDFAPAQKAYRAALKQQPLLAGALLGLGKCNLQAGDIKKATLYMERAVRVRPTLTEALYLLGKAYENIDQQKSLRYYQYFRKQAASDPEFLNHLSEVQERISSLSNKETKG